VAITAQRYMHEYGIKREHFGAVAIACRKHANRNPRAIFHDRPLTMEEYLNAPMLSYPLCRYDYCLETDGACAFVVTTAERARDLRKPPAYILAAAQGTGPEVQTMVNYYRPSITWPYETEECAKALWAMAGVGPEDVDVAQIYDHFTPLVLLALEGFGFCGRGEAGEFVEGGRIEIGGTLPINTAGGLLSEAYIHGWNLINEGVRQIRGESTCQVEGAELCLVTSGNGVPTSAILLRR